MGTVALRTSLIWHDEVMADLVHERLTPITIGASSEATLLTPDLGLPAVFSIMRPGHRGYLLTLGDRMRGTISVAGVEHDVATFVRTADEPSEFRATSIGGSDWGVVELDESGDCKLFFQFVPVDEPTWKLTGPILDGESRASLAFSVVLHLALLLATFRLADYSEPFVWPGPRAVTGSYIVARLDAEPPPEPTVSEKEPAKAGAMAPTVSATDAPIANPLPTSRGKWTRPVKPTPKPSDDDTDGGEDSDEPETTVDPTAAVGIMQYEDLLRGVRDRELAKAIKNHNRLANGKNCKKGEHCPETGGGDGRPGRLRGGDGHEDGTFGDGEKTGELKTGSIRNAVCLGSGCGDGGTPMLLTLPSESTDDGPTITKEDIDRVMKKNQGMFRSCYQRALDRNNGNLAGDLIVKFQINADGRAISPRSMGGTLRGTDVSSCVTATITRLQFPARGGAIVNYPFMFSSGGN